MSAITRFKNRKNLALEFEIGFPIDTKELVFKVNRFSPAEMKVAGDNAKGSLAKQGVLDSDERRLEKFYLEYAYCLSDIVKRHVTSWKHAPSDDSSPIEYSKGALESLFNEMSIDEKTQIGLSYLRALEEEEEKKTEA